MATLERRLEQLEAAVQQRQPTHSPLLPKLREDPTRLMTEAGLTPDPWQQSLLCSISPRTLLLCSRQAGKSTTAGALALLSALLRPRALILLLSPSLRQSQELFRKVLEVYQALRRPIATDQASALQLQLSNGSRIISLPGQEATIRGYSGVTLLVIDEAARVSDALYCSTRPMLAVSRGRMICLSTPFGKRGWFHDAWHSSEPWERVRITANMCPRIPPAFLAEEQQALGNRWYRQEYLCSFEDTIDAVFQHADIQAALSMDVRPLFE